MGSSAARRDQPRLFILSLKEDEAIMVCLSELLRGARITNVWTGYPAAYWLAAWLLVRAAAVAADWEGRG